MLKLIVFSLLCVLGLGWLFVENERARLREVLEPCGAEPCGAEPCASWNAPTTHSGADAAREWYRVIA